MTMITDTDDTKMPLTSLDVNEERRQQLMALFPEAFSEGKLDLDGLKAALGDGGVTTGPERYELTWAGKSEAKKAIQTLSAGTLVPAPDESVNFDTTQNLIIEGDNLEVLKLLQKSYQGKVKMIYIDPPYNTGGEFIYPDRFQEGLQDYLKFSGQVTGEGVRVSANTETEGRFHSKWMSMMYPRLFMARNLLREDGLIFVSIDDNELQNLRQLMNEVFGEENFRNNIVVRRGIKNVQSQFEEVQQLSVGHEYILLYSRSANAKLPKLDKAHNQQQGGKWDTFWRGTDRPTMRYELFGQIPESGQWRWEEERAKIAINNYEQYLQNNEDGVTLDDYYLHSLTSNNEKLDFLRLGPKDTIQYFVPPKDSKLLSDNWMDITLSGNYPYFDTSKNPEIIKRMIKWVTSPGDTILDFFAGSGTTAYAVLELNAVEENERKFVLVQIPEPLDSGKKENAAAISHLEKLSVPKNIAEITKDRVRQVINRMNADDASKLALTTGDTVTAPADRGFKVFKLTDSNFKTWNADEAPKDADALAAQLRLYADNLVEGRTQTDVLYEILLKAGFPLTETVEAGVIEGHTVYSIAGGALLICLDNPIAEGTLKAILALDPAPAQVICLDAAFAGNDPLKTNIRLEMKAHGIEFRTV